MVQLSRQLFVVVLPGEVQHEIYGPFRRLADAKECAQRWNDAQPGMDEAYVMDIRDPEEML